MYTRLLSTLGLLAVLAIAFGGIGMAYTASTENAGNTVTSEYVVLEQRGYDFTLTDGLKIDIVTSELGTYYQLRNAVEIEPKIDGAKYYGVEISTDILQATVVGSWDGKVQVCTPKINDTWFTDYSNNAMDWRYVLKVTGEVDGQSVTQYAYYDGKTPADGEMINWKVIKKDGGDWVYTDNGEPLTELYIVEDVQYDTTLYFAGVGAKVNDGSFKKATGRTIHLTDEAIITPVWTISGDGDVKNTIKNFDSPEAATAAEKVYNERHLYFKSGGNIILPPNQFTNSDEYPEGKVFAGWWNESKQKVYYTRYVFPAEQNYEFVAQWASVSECTEIRFDVNLPAGYEATQNDVVEMSSEYLLRGGYYAIPANKFSLTGYMFVGWSVGEDSTIYQPGISNTVPYDQASITLKAHWEPWSNSSPYKKITFSGEVHFTPYTLVVYTDKNGDYVLPENILGPTVDISQYPHEWKFAGWSIQQKNEARDGKIIAQSYTMPTGTDNKIINNGTIKFIYIKDQEES